MVLPSPPPHLSTNSIEHNCLMGGEETSMQPATNLITKVLTSVVNNSEDSSNNNDTEISCSICLEVMDEEEGNLYTISECKHTFHIHCIKEWKKQSKKCPFCLGSLPEEIGPTLTRLENLPAEEVNQEVTRCGMLQNLFFCVLWIAYPLFLVSLFLACETASCALFVVPFFFMMVYYFFLTEEYVYAGILSTFFCIIYPIVVCCLVAAFIVQAFYMFYRTIKFYVKVVRCEVRWSFGYRFIIVRTMTLTSYWADVLL